MTNKTKQDETDTVVIRHEKESDYREVEEMIRKCFWDLYVPGCQEHYLAHIMRKHEDFIPELDFVIELNGKIIGNIMYTKTKLVDESGEEKNILTFGPVCILPEYQRKGYSKKLLEHSFEEAIKLGYDMIIIFGNPSNYVSRGFKSSKKYNIRYSNGIFPTAMMVKELLPVGLEKKNWVYHESPAMTFNQEDVEIFDQGFEKWEKSYQPSQEEFYINSNSSLQ